VTQQCKCGEDLTQVQPWLVNKQENQSANNNPCIEVNRSTDVLDIAVFLERSQFLGADAVNTIEIEGFKHTTLYGLDPFDYLGEELYSLVGQFLSLVAKARNYIVRVVLHR
jgi:hypothetical protein